MRKPSQFSMWVCAIFAVLLWSSAAYAGGGSGYPGIGSAWSVFSSGQQSVSKVLNRLGPTVYDGSTVQGHLMILWTNGAPTVLLNGAAISNTTVTYGMSHVAMSGTLPGTPLRNTTVDLMMNASGQLAIQVSASPGQENGMQILLNPVTGVQLAAGQVCMCWGGADVPKRRCTNPECNDPGTTCNTNPGGAQAYCEWRNPGTKLSVVGTVDVATISH